jgi:hypothetical protein
MGNNPNNSQSSKTIMLKFLIKIRQKSIEQLHKLTSGKDCKT